MRLFQYIGIAVGLAVSLVGCNKPEAAGPAGPPPLAEVTLGYFANVTHAQAVLGVASGDFQKALGSTQLKTKVFNAGPELMNALNAGAIDVGYVGPGPVIAAHVNAHGQAVRVISGSAANGVVIVASRQSGIHTFRELKDKMIATPQLGNTQDVSARHFVTEILGEVNSDNVKEVRNSQQAGLMERGTIDAAWVPEPWGSRLIDETGAVLVGEEKDLWPSHEFALTVIVTSPAFLANHPDVIEKLLAVHHAWTVKLSEHADDYAGQLNDALAALGGLRLPGPVMHEALSRTMFTDDPMPLTFATMEKWSHNLKFIDSAPDLTGLFDTQILTRVMSEPQMSAPAAPQP